VNSKLLFSSLLLYSFILSNTDVIANEITANDSVLWKSFRTLTFCAETYQISSAEKIVLYGAKDRKWIAPSWYWGEAGYGAIGGKRSGYIEGGIMLGHQSSFAPNLLYDLRIFFGAGGGGSAPQGGGMIIQPTMGLGIELSSQVNMFLELGYMHFINGNISSPSVGFTINFNQWALFSSDE